MIAIIDYGMGNLHSVYNALQAIGAQAEITSDPEQLKQADGIILPGVGAFRDCMRNLEQSGLIDTIKSEAAQGKPLLGICLGMQVLFEKGYEVEECAGLGLLQGEIRLMEEGEHPFVYYVHSYRAQDHRDEDLVAYSEYGSLKIPGYVRHGNILGMQYHPEKSGEDGLNMLRKFAALCEEGKA